MIDDVASIIILLMLCVEIIYTVVYIFNGYIHHSWKPFCCPQNLSFHSISTMCCIIIDKSLKIILTLNKNKNVTGFAKRGLVRRQFQVSLFMAIRQM